MGKIPLCRAWRIEGHHNLRDGIPFPLTGWGLMLAQMLRRLKACGLASKSRPPSLPPFSVSEDTPSEKGHPCVWRRVR